MQDSVASIRGIHTYRHLCVIEKYDQGQGLVAASEFVPNNTLICVQNICWLMVSWGTILPNILGIGDYNNPICIDVQQIDPNLLRMKQT